MLIDSHCHLDWDNYQDDLSEILNRAKEAGVSKIVTIGTNEASQSKTRVLVTRFPEVSRTIGFHPDCVLEEGFELETINRYIKILEKEVEFPQTVGIGECGLDYYCLEKGEIASSHKGTSLTEAAQARKDELKDLQRELFERQILFAIQHSLPLTLHVRDTGEDAYTDVVSILEEYFGDGQDYDTLSYGFSLGNFQKKYSSGTNTDEEFKRLESEVTGEIEKSNFRGVLHCVSGPDWYVDRCIELGFCISFAGNLTYKNVDLLVGHAKRVALDKILVETDGPFLAPLAIRGQRNEPVSVLDVAKKIAEIKGITFEEVCSQTVKNTEKLFGI